MRNISDKTMTLSPLILTVYNRPIHTKETVEALLKNELASKSILYIYSDYPKKEEHREDVKKVREYIHTIKGFKEIHITKRKQNYGLAKSIIQGVTEVINKHNKVILIEDDLVTSPMFLTYMNNMLDKYKDEKKIYSITGYNFPPKLMKIPKDYKYDIYFSPRAGSWGWATWKDRWNNADWEVKDYEEFLKNKQLQKEFNKGGDDLTDMLIKQMNGDIDSWAIRWCYTHFINNAYCIYPVKSYVDNIGMDGSGVHCGKTKKYLLESLNGKDYISVPQKISFDKNIKKVFQNIYKKKFIKKTYFCLKNSLGKISLERLWKILISKFNLGPVKSVWYGNEYGGFYLNTRFLSKKSIIYSIGIGEDISFDKDVIKRIGCVIYGFDPTPKSINWVRNNKVDGFNFYKYGIGVKSGKEKLYLPKNKNFVSGSIVQTENTSSDYTFVTIKTLDDIMNALGHKKIDVLKMDIEGMEYDVLKDILKKKIPIQQILVEFHDRFIQNGYEKRKEIENLLRKKGYICYAISKSMQEISFIHNSFVK